MNVDHKLQGLWRPLYPICCFSIENVVSERDRAMCVVTNRHAHTTKKRITHIRNIFPRGVHSLGSISTTFIVYIHANLAECHCAAYIQGGERLDDDDGE
jgi:hypothetical protein